MTSFKERTERKTGRVESYDYYSGDQGEVMKVSVSHRKGGINYWSYEREQGGVEIFVSPVTLEKREGVGLDGQPYSYTMEGMTLHLGGGGRAFRANLLPLEKLNRKKITAVAKALEPVLDQLVEAAKAGRKQEAYTVALDAVQQAGIK